MIERIYAHNFRCLEDCEVHLDPVTLFLGTNGTGKSSLFDVVSMLQQFILGIPQVFNGDPPDIFPSRDLTSWSTTNEQRFELDIQLAPGLYRYQLELAHHPDQQMRSVKLERLTLEGQSLFESCNDKAYPLNGGDRPHNVGILSGLSEIKRTSEGEKINHFQNYLEQLLFLRPASVMSITDERNESGDTSSEDLQSSSTRSYSLCQGLMQHAEFHRALRVVRRRVSNQPIPSLADTAMAEKVLRYALGADRITSLGWHQLSDGQRQLVFLYTLLYGTPNSSRTLFLDEPDNFVSLREIQPWLASLIDSVGDHMAQAVIISHHPEIIDYLARERGVWFTRESSGPTHVIRKDLSLGEPLRVSELEARGW